MKIALLLGLLSTWAFAAVAAENIDFSAMSESEKNKTGLYKLSEREVQALQNWLNNKQETIAQESKEKNAGFEQKQITERDTIVAQVAKRYKDPLGNTFYKLTNGQVWKQVSAGRITISGDTPTVSIEPQMMGSWMMKGEGNRGVKVKRIR